MTLIQIMLLNVLTEKLFVRTIVQQAQGLYKVKIITQW